MYAGAPSVGVTLWPVADRSTAELMADFYKRLLGGARRDHAFGRAARRAPPDDLGQAVRRALLLGALRPRRRLALIRLASEGGRPRPSARVVQRGALV